MSEGMILLSTKMNQLIEDQRNVHVLYSFHEVEDYMKQVLNYIHDGIIAGESIILIENARLYPEIQKELSSKYTKTQLELVHYVNSLDFYFSSGSYHPPAIHEYFKKVVQPYIQNDTAFRSWAHVEWASMQEPLYLIEDFEKIVDEEVNALSFPLICAYDGVKLPEYVKTFLMETHPYVLVEDDVVVSKQYLPSNKVI